MLNRVQHREIISPPRRRSRFSTKTSVGRFISIILHCLRVRELSVINKIYDVPGQEIIEQTIALYYGKKGLFIFSLNYFCAEFDFNKARYAIIKTTKSGL